MMNTVDKFDAIYARQSIDKPDSISIESQIEMCIYETRGYPYRIFTDKGYSGKNTERPGFLQMQQLIRQGYVRRVICYKLDRCSRSILDFTALMETLQENHVEFVSCTEKFDTSTPIGRAMLNICIVFAQLERETIQQRVSDAYYSRHLKGFYMGGKTPFGFKKEPCEIDGKSTFRFTADTEETEILRNIYRFYAKPGVSLGDVVRWLNDKEIPHPRKEDKKWVRSHIGRMLANPVYVRADASVFAYYQSLGVQIHNCESDFIGKYGCFLFTRHGKDLVAEQHLIIAPHEGIIDSDIWLRCRKKHEPPKGNTPMHSMRNSWLAGKMKCAYCGYAMVIKKTCSSSGSSYRYIVCSRGCRQLHKDHIQNYYAEDLESEISEHLQERMNLLLCVPEAEHNPESAETLKQLQKASALLEARIQKLTDQILCLEGPFPERLYRKLGELEEENRAVQIKIRQILLENHKKTDPPSLCPWHNLTFSQKQRITDLLIQKIILGAEIVIHWNPGTSVMNEPT